jgi:hypothetical protein
MKKLVLLGVIALGSMSFVAADCFAIADAAVANRLKQGAASEEVQDATWDGAWYGCNAAQGSLMSAVTVIAER